MGLFSLFGKNKQETAGQDSGYYSREEDPAAVRARSKRASSAGEGAAPRASRKTRAVDDPVLPEKKRARRRLVGAIALALAVAVGLPMILDSEPKPIASDIAIQIPSRDKVAPLPLPASPAEARPSAPPAAETLDQREQLVDPSEVKTVKLKSADAPVVVADAKPVKKVESAQEEAARAKVDSDKAEAREKAEAKAHAEAKAKAEARARQVEKDKEAEKARDKLADKPARADDAARAQAILEGKAKAADAPAAAPKFVVQVAALASQEKVDELQEKLGAAGIRAHTRKISTASGERIQVRIGPLSREEADRMHGRLDKAGLTGSMVRPEGK